jgi:hypothetical protein
VTKTKKPTKNVTLTLPEPLLKQFRVFAAERDKSMTQLMAEAINLLMDREDERKATARRMIERMRNAPDRGTNGVITWTRDEIHPR